MISERETAKLVAAKLRGSFILYSPNLFYNGLGRKPLWEDKEACQKAYPDNVMKIHIANELPEGDYLVHGGENGHYTLQVGRHGHILIREFDDK